ncbi:type II secretion system protein GspM [Marinobacter sp. P4B1]|uniref:type II secretion system protein GspM n=1 Tax=Marinobacter sp. P4B1 TaxID=1119533 RepID=UPI00071D2571|nr:type II secretion system protein GspM [Marinobacter sp. P4B1]KRW81753.1 MSHA biogenesis protein MshJ [Marinobacter sp. P4B1]
MSKLSEQLAAGAAWYNERPVRERGLIAVTLCVLVLVLGWELFVAPVDAQKQQLNNRIQTLSANRDNLLSQQQTLSSQLERDPSAELRERLAARQNRLERLDQQITETTGQLIAPRDMVALLRNMLAAQQGLTLESLSLLAPQPVYGEQGVAPDGSEARAPEPLLYAHDVELTISGGYLNVLNYLERLESMDDRIGWLQLIYDAGSWPKGEARIRVRTLSLEAAWLGV